MSEIKRIKYFNQQVPGLDDELEYISNQILSKISVMGNVAINLAVEGDFNTIGVKFDLNTLSSNVIAELSADQWLTEIIVVTYEVFDAEITFSIKRQDTGEVFVSEDKIGYDEVDSIDIKPIYTEFTATTSLIFEFNKGSCTTGKGIIFVKIYTP